MSKNYLYTHVAAVTGSLGSGKTTVCRLLQGFGASLVSADQLAHKAVQTNSACLSQIEKTFGRSVLDAQGHLNRQQLAEIVFQHPHKRLQLEAIIHPEVRRLALVEFEKAKKLSPPLIVYDCPLFFEAGLQEQGFKAVITVAADRELCIQRAMQRLELSRKDVERRIDAQLPIEQKCAGADYIIENNSGLPELEAKVRQVYEALV